MSITTMSITTNGNSLIKVSNNSDVSNTITLSSGTNGTTISSNNCFYYGDNYPLSNGPCDSQPIWEVKPYTTPFWDHLPTWPLTIKTTSTTFLNEFKNTNNNMKITTKYKEEKLLLIAELAGFKKEEIKIKYENPLKDISCVCVSQDKKSYISIVAESESHVYKGEKEKSYKLDGTHYIDKSKTLDIYKTKVTLADGLLTIEIEYAEDSKVKQLPIG